MIDIIVSLFCRLEAKILEENPIREVRLQGSVQRCRDRRYRPTFCHDRLRLGRNRFPRRHSTEWGRTAQTQAHALATHASNQRDLCALARYFREVSVRRLLYVLRAFLEKRTVPNASPWLDIVRHDTWARQIQHAQPEQCALAHSLPRDFHRGTHSHRKIHLLWRARWAPSPASRRWQGLQTSWTHSSTEIPIWRQALGLLLKPRPRQRVV